MAPKRERSTAKQKAKEEQGLASGPILDAEQQAALDRSKHLQELAVQNGVLSRFKRLNTEELPLPAVLQQADGKDIVKKSSTRKGRYLLNICAKLAPAAAGQLVRLNMVNVWSPARAARG